jgi:hypothetical protein
VLIENANRVEAAPDILEITREVARNV